MTNYVDNLKTKIGGLVDSLIKNELCQELPIVNGVPPKGAAQGTGRFGNLEKLNPRTKTSDKVGGGSKLYINAQDALDI